MSLTANEQMLLKEYPQWKLNPKHPNDCVVYQAAVHLVDECKKTGHHPDNANGYWTPVMDAIQANGWYIVNVRGKFELVTLKEGISPSMKHLTEADVLQYLY